MQWHKSRRRKRDEREKEIRSLSFSSCHLKSSCVLAFTWCTAKRPDHPRCTSLLIAPCPCGLSPLSVVTLTLPNDLCPPGSQGRMFCSTLSNGLRVHHCMRVYACVCVCVSMCMRWENWSYDAQADVYQGDTEFYIHSSKTTR